MKLDYKIVVILALIAVVVALILFRGCGRNNRPSKEIDIVHIYDSIERVIVSQLPPPDTVFEINEKTVIKWLPSAKVVDTFYVDGETVYVYNDAPVDTNAILTHYLTQAATYIDTIRDSSLQAVILDTIFRNSIVARDFRYKILRPIEIQKIDNSDRFQFHVLGGTGSQTDMDSIFKLRLSGGIMMEFKTGTSLIVRYDHTVGSKNPHGFEVMAAQRLRLRKR